LLKIVINIFFTHKIYFKIKLSRFKTMKKHIYIPIAIVLLATICEAQNPNLFYNKGADITVQAGAIVTVKGELVNADNGANIGKIHNDGDIYVSENWTNNSTSSALDAIVGTVYLDGTATIANPYHLIGGTTETTFNNLFLGNAKPAKLLVNTTVSGTTGSLDLNSVFLELNSKTLSVTNPVPAGPLAAIKSTLGGIIISETDFASGYGIVKWFMPNPVLGNKYIIPFGTSILAPNALSSVPITFEPTNNVNSLSGSVSFSTYPTSASAALNNRPLPNGVPNTNSPCGAEWAKYTTDRFYVINPQGYSTLPVTKISLGYVDDEWDLSSASTNLITENKLKIERFDAKWNILGGTTNTATNVATKGGINKYGVFALTNFEPLKPYYKDSSMVSCFNGNDGKFNIGITTGNKPYTINFLPTPNLPQLDSAITGLVAGFYQVKITDAAGCDTTLRKIKITEPPILKIDSISGTKLTCPLSSDAIVTFKGTGGTPNANTPLYTFTCTPNNAVAISAFNATATYTGLPSGLTTIQIKDAKNCIATTTVFLVPPPKFTVSLSPDVAVCEGKKASVFANIGIAPFNGKGPYSYSWLELPSLAPVAVHSNPLDNDTLSLINPTTQQYAIEVTDACGTKITQQKVEMKINPLPVPDFTAPQTSGCENLNVLFSGATTSIAPPSTITGWLWDFGDGTATSSAPNPQHLYDTKGSYDVTLTATSSEGCSELFKSTGYITVNPNPVAAFNYNPETTTIINPYITFDNNSSADVTFSQWNFGENGTIQTNVPKSYTYTYKDTGTYNVVLKVTNQFNCSDSIMHPVTILPNITLFIPNSFTPNSDNINEIFYPKGSYYKNFVVRIYDRWGEKIFVSGEANQGWDGTLSNGVQAPVGVYVYKIKLEELTGKDRYYSGTISLIR
jgi:gliding motility-associated-like protein